MPPDGPSLPPSPAGDPSPDDARRARDRRLASETFRTSDRLRHFLSHLASRAVEGDRASLKESVIGAEVFGRVATFEPHDDPVVRVEARRLRFKLRDYYDTEGREDAMVIELPKGSYHPRFVRRGLPDAPNADTGELVGPGRESAPADRDAGVNRRRRSSRVRRAALAAVAASIVIRRSAFPAGGGGAVAVLPFDNVSGGAKNEEFCFGLVEELTTELARVPGLRVVARSSSFQFPPTGRGLNLIEAGRQLGAAFVIEGSVRRQDDRVRVTAQLIALPSGVHLWANTFDRRASDAFGVQDEVARQVAAELERRIPGVGPRPSRPRRPPSPTAYDLYLRGRYLRGRKSADDVRRAVAAFEAATTADPSFAPAHSAMADALATLGFHGHDPQPIVIPRAEAAIARALALDVDLPEAYATRAWIQFFHDWDWPAADQSFRRALALNPNLAPTHNLFGLALVARRRFDPALEHVRLARELDPLTYAASNEMGLVLMAMGRAGDALAYARRTLETQPSFYAAHAVAGLAHVAVGRDSLAVADNEAGLAEGQRHVYLLGGLGFAVARSGRQAETARVADEVDRSCASGTGCMWLAAIREGFGDHAGTVTALDRAVEARDPDLPFLDINPLLAGLAGQAGFEKIRRQVGLSPGS